MRSLLRPTLVRRVVIALLSGFVLAWAALIAVNCLTIWRQQAQTAQHFDTSPRGVLLRLALSGVEEPAEARAIAAAQERILNEDRWSAGMPGTRCSRFGTGGSIVSFTPHQPLQTRFCAAIRPNRHHKDCTGNCSRSSRWICRAGLCSGRARPSTSLGC